MADVFPYICQPGHLLQALSEAGTSVIITSLQIFGPPDSDPEQGPLSIFAKETASPVDEGCAQV